MTRSHSNGRSMSAKAPAAQALHDAATPAAPRHNEDRYQVPALQRGLQLLAQFTRDERRLTGAELARRLALPRASVFRLLQTLEQLGFVERVGDSAQYKLGMAVLRLGFEYLASMELTELGRPIIVDLAGVTGLSAHLVVRDGREVVFVAKAVGRSFMFNSIQIGARLPAHATVLGRILLGDLTAGNLHALYQGVALDSFTAQTPTTLAALEQAIAEDAQRGYGISEGGFEAAISTIAAPVFDDHQRVSAAVSVTVPASHVDLQSRDELVAQVRGAAQRLSQCISHLPPTGSSIPHFSQKHKA